LTHSRRHRGACVTAVVAAAITTAPRRWRQSEPMRASDGRRGSRWRRFRGHGRRLHVRPPARLLTRYGRPAAVAAAVAGGGAAAAAAVEETPAGEEERQHGGRLPAVSHLSGDRRE